MSSDVHSVIVMEPQIP